MTQTSTARQCCNTIQEGRAHTWQRTVPTILWCHLPACLYRRRITQIVAGRIDGPAGSYGGILSTRDEDGYCCGCVPDGSAGITVLECQHQAPQTINTWHRAWQSFIRSVVQPLVVAADEAQSGTVAGTRVRFTPKAYTDRIAHTFWRLQAACLGCPADSTAPSAAGSRFR